MMNQNEIDRAVRTAQQWNIYAPLASKNVSPAEIKQAIVGVLAPYFTDKKQLQERAIDVLASEAFRVARIQQDTWLTRAFSFVLSTYNEAEKANSIACYKACADSEDDILTAQTEHWSLLYLEVDKEDLPLEEFKHEIFRNIGAIIESYLLPHLRDILIQNRLIRGKSTTYSAIINYKLGDIVNELHDTIKMPEIVAPLPWGIRLNQWRNIAQHYRSRVNNGLIYSYYGEPPHEQEVILKRTDLLDAFKRIYSICDAVNTARTLFVIDKMTEIHKYLQHPPKLRIDADVLSLSTALSTQGFSLDDLRIDDNLTTATVRDLSDGPPRDRMIHASQFVFPVWNYFPRQTVVVKYIDKAGALRLTTSVSGTDCKKISDGAIPFAELANLVILDFEGQTKRNE